MAVFMFKHRRFTKKTLIKFYFLVPIIGIILIFYMVLSKTVPNNSIQDSNEISRFVRTVNYKSKWDSTETYRITPSLAKRDLVLGRNDVTLVTQCSHQKIFSILNILDVWQGPVSVAVFSMPGDVNDVLVLVALLRNCFVDVRNYVTFHLVTYEGNGNVKDDGGRVLDCRVLDGAEESLKSAQNYDLSVPYPVNVMRNTARKNLDSKYFFLIDIDMLPNRGLRQNFIKFIEDTHPTNKSVYVVPAFEMQEHEALPDSKQHVKMYFSRRTLRPFYTELCFKCQSCVDYSSWLHLPDTTGLSAAYQLTWHDSCEPFYIANTKIPFYDEAFKQYGFNRISQVCELFVAGYTFFVLDNAFLVHMGLKTKTGFHPNKDSEQELNRRKYREFKQNLKFKYPGSDRSC